MNNRRSLVRIAVGALLLMTASPGLRADLLHVRATVKGMD